jgi:hypothetical protein
LARANIGLVANLESLAIASAVAFSSGRAFLKGWPNHEVEVTFTRDVVISAENSEMATGCETAAAAPSKCSRNLGKYSDQWDPAFKDYCKKYPNYGKSVGMSSQQWWEEVGLHGFFCGVLYLMYLSL